MDRPAPRADARARDASSARETADAGPANEADASAQAATAPAAGDSAAWYEQGLRFECTGCGRCCTGSGGYVWTTVDEIRALASLLGFGLDDFGRRYLRRVGARYALVDAPGGACVFLEGRSCRVYEARPAQCRAFPWWPANLESPEAWARAAADCEGIRPEAPLVPRRRIDEALATAGVAAITGGSEGR